MNKENKRNHQIISSRYCISKLYLKIVHLLYKSRLKKMKINQSDINGQKIEI